MPRKNKRKFFGKSSKNKSTKSNRDAPSSDGQQLESDSEEKCDDNASGERRSLVSNDSTSAMGQLESVASSEVNVSALPKDEQHHKATITLKVIQFVGDVPSDTRDDDSGSMRHGEQRKIEASPEINEIESDDKSLDNKSVTADTSVEISERNALHSELDVVGDVPKLDHNKESEKSDEAGRHQRSFDDNYRVESPKQICTETTPTHQRTKRHAMFIQEISESSSSEEVKQFLDSEATALEMKTDKLEVETVPKNYRVDSPESSDENNNSRKVVQDDPMVQEISESSSSESVKNEILASIRRQSPPQKFDTKPGLKIINIKELPSEDSGKSIASSSKINIESKTEKKLNKAEEAILEALYGNKSLLQIPNLPLDVISEEGSDCGSDVDKQPSQNLITDELDDEVFLPSTTTSSDFSKKPPSARKRSNQTTRAVCEPAMLINTKIIEAESNIPESCKSWEMTQGDNELQAELVYLTSTSSSATDLSERGDITDTESVGDSSEDTETNSLLENISVPSLEEQDMPIEIRFCPPSPVYSCEYFQEASEQKLPDILEEDEEQAPKSLDIIESQQQIEDVNNELHHLDSELRESQTRQKIEHVSAAEGEINRKEEEVEVEAAELKRTEVAEQISEENVHETISDAPDKKKISADNEKDLSVSNRVTPTLFKRKNSSDSSSSANSQCTIIRQAATSHQHVDPLKDLCVQSLSKSGFTLDDGSRGKDDGMITVHKHLNSPSRNAPQIPIMNELELHYECDNHDLEGREKSKDRVITILQVPPAMSAAATSDKERWIGFQSTQIPNLLIALSPSQNTYMMNSQDSNSSADVLLDMHKKFVERRAYHETHESAAVENSNNSRQTSQLERANQLEDGYFGDRENSVEKIVAKTNQPPEIKSRLSESESSAVNCDNEENEALTSRHENKATVKSAEGDIRMNSIRNFILRDEFFKNTFADAKRESTDSTANNFEGKKFELENELKRLDTERRELEEELKNLQSLQHFKREEFLFNEKKLQERIDKECDSRRSSIKYANDDFNEFINSNERLQQELYNEWQDKVLERYERKLQKTIKITSITEAIHHDDHLERAASEILRFVPLENEFMTKLKERQKRLSLPTETELNSSTESLHHQNEEIKKTDKKQQGLHMPAHLHEFLKYYEEEIAQSKNSDESGESKVLRPLLIGLIGVSMCLCGFYIGKHLITQRSNLF